MKKKLLISVENFQNIFILLFLRKIKQNFDITILSSKNLIPSQIKKKYKIIKIKKNFIEKFIDKICIYFADCHGSHKQLYYLNFQLESEKNLFLYAFLKIKYHLSKLGILPYAHSLNKFFYFYYRGKYDFLKNYDYFLFDFRISDDHNFSKRILYSSIFYKNLKRIAWVYSWDNTYIYSSTLSADFFITWSNPLKKIFIKRHNIKNKRVFANYPIQFEYLNKTKEKKEKKSLTILYCCSYGSPSKNPESDVNWYVKDDIEMIKNINQIINKNKLNLKILVRLYPYTNYSRITFLELDKLKSLKIDYDSFRFYKRKFFNYPEIADHLKKKNQSINDSLAVFSFGSTFNIESAILNKPVFHIEYSVVKRNHTLYSYENFQKNIEDYVFLKNVKNSNIIKNNLEMEKILIDLNRNKYSKYLEYSKSLRKIFNCKQKQFEKFYSKKIQLLS
jgi:hypothetical protein